MPEPFFLIGDDRDKLPVWTVDTFVEGMVLDVAGGDEAEDVDDAALLQWEYHGGRNQGFYAVPLPDDEWMLISRVNGRLLDVRGDGDAGSGVIAYAAHLGANQRWYFGPDEGGHRRQIFNASKRLALSVANAERGHGHIIVAYPNDAPDQRFNAHSVDSSGADVFLP